MRPTATPSLRLRRALAWLAALGLAQAGAMLLLGRLARELDARAQALAAAGLLAPPQGAAAEALLGWGAASGAALAYTLGIGLAAALLARALADVLAGAPTPLRLLPVPLAAAAALGMGAYTGMVALWGWLAVIFAVPYAVLAGPPQGSPAHRAGRRAAATWLAALLLVGPALSLAGAEHLRAARAALLAAPGGTDLVNAYYRHALLAAEPVKSPAQRLYRVYATTPDTGPVPEWLRCARAPWPLLPIARPARADFVVTAADARSVRLAPYAGVAGRRVTASGLGSALDAVQARADPRPWRRVVALGVLIGVPGTAAWLLAGGALAVAGRRPGAAVAGCALAGVLLGAAVASWGQARPAPEAVHARLLAAADPATPLSRLRALASADPVLPVRAHALAAWARRMPAEEAAERVRAAPTWYEQWHGYRALLDRGWHPVPGCG
jgi:hypothetical protein